MWNVAFAQVDKANAQYKWVTGEPVKYKNWAVNEPAIKQNRELFGAILADGTWQVSEGAGSENKSGVYEFESKTEIPEKSHQIEWVHWKGNIGGNGHWYGVFKNFTDEWPVHKRMAEQLGAHIATISSEEENKFVNSITRKYGKVWIGLTVRPGGGGGGTIPTVPKGGYERVDITGRGPGFQQMPSTSPMTSAPQQVQGTATRMSLRMR